MKGHRDKILSLCIMDKYLFSGSADGFVYQWDLVSGDGINFMPMTRSVWALAASPLHPACYLTGVAQVLCLAAWHQANLLIAGDEQPAGIDPTG